MIDVNSWMVQYPNFRDSVDCELIWPCCTLLLLELRAEEESENHAFTVQSSQPENHRCVLQSGCMRLLVPVASTSSSRPPAAQQAQLGEAIQCADQRRVRGPSVGDRHHGTAAVPGDGRRAGRCFRRGPHRHRDLQPAWREVLQEFDSAGV